MSKTWNNQKVIKMYFEDVFTNKEYEEVLENLKRRRPFEKEYLLGKKYKFEFGLVRVPKSCIDIWQEPYMISFGYSFKSSGGGGGELVSEVLENFESYSKACTYLGESWWVKHCEECEEKYDGLRGQQYEQMMMW